MNYKAVQKHMNNVVRYISKQNCQRIKICYDKDYDGFETHKATSKVRIGVADIVDKESIMFADAVYYIINVAHECNHSVQFNNIRHSKVISDDVKTFGAEYSNKFYYYTMYHHSVLELDAQFRALIVARDYLHKEYADYKDVMDQHILYWGKKWFEGAIPSGELHFQWDGVSSLDDFIDVFSNYINNHWDYGTAMSYQENRRYQDVIWHVIQEHKIAERIHPYDNCFVNSDDIRIQRDAAFLINVHNNEELRKIVPVVNDNEQIKQVESELLTSFQNVSIKNEEFDISRGVQIQY